jgi:hypothetical protein
MWQERSFAVAADKNPLEVFADPKSAEDDAYRAARRLATDKDVPNARALLKIADDARLSDGRRRQAVLLFWRRHATAGTPIDAVGAALAEGSRWLERDNIRIVPGSAGQLPVRPGPGTVFMVRISIPKGKRGTVYVRVEGRVAEEDFAAALMKGRTATSVTSKVLELGFSVSEGADRELTEK